MTDLYERIRDELEWAVHEVNEPYFDLYVFLDEIRSNVNNSPSNDKLPVIHLIDVFEAMNT